MSIRVAPFDSPRPLLVQLFCLFRRTTIYAIVETGGKQYRVAPGQTIEVDRLGLAEGNTIDLDRVLLISDGEKVTVGTPTIEGAKVVATSKGEKRGDKVIVFKYKSKTRYRRKKGHHQLYTSLNIDKIIPPVAEVVDAKAEVGEPKKTRRRKKEVTEDGA